ncbi:DMT family transporter [uncultured Shimia sp.]|uniref:DMT family transporter n=1 Tax=uncultured Shimia sp. TaxID=573152 RepID=UPI0026036638|nr:DMT family transporter [uncultured Shimia sp.]
MAKGAVDTYQVLQILFFRQIVVFLSALPTIARSLPGSLRTRHPGWHALRLAGASASLACGIWAVSVLPLTTASTLGFANVFFVALLAMWVLGEPLGRHRMAAIVAGFIGVVIVMRPGLDAEIAKYALIPLAAALGAAVARLAVRRLSQGESTATLLLYQSLFAGLASGVPLVWLWVTPGWFDLGYLLAMGLLASVGQWLGIKALRLGEASVVSSIDYTQLIYAAVLGFAVFDEIPDGFTIAGAVMIVGAAVSMFYRERMRTVGVMG